MSNIIREKRCLICDSLIPVGRIQRHPCAVLCGVTACSIEHKRRSHNRAQQKWRITRGIRDPAFRERLNSDALTRYRKRKALRSIAG